MNSFIVQPPPPFVINADNVEARFADFKNKFERFLKANGLDSKEEGQKIAIFKSLCGDDLLHLTESFDSEEETLADLLQKLLDYYTPASNLLQERFNFFIRRQRTNENFDKYLIELKKIAKNCNFGDLEESLIKVALIMNVRDPAEQKVFLKDADTKKLDTLVPEFRQFDTIKKNVAKNQPQLQKQHSDSGKNQNQPGNNKDQSTQKEQQKNNKQPTQNPPQQPKQKQPQAQPQKQQQQPPNPNKDANKPPNANGNAAQPPAGAKRNRKKSKPQNGDNKATPNLLDLLEQRVKNMTA